MKYATSQSENDNYRKHNLLGLDSNDDAAFSQAESFGFAKATLISNLELQKAKKTNKPVKFTVKYILYLHQLALGHLYSFAGEIRTVNISKDGFPFPSANFLTQTMAEFEREHLSPLPDSYTDPNSLILDIGRIHAELLFIHPFREGNGRIARLFADLMAIKAGYQPLDYTTLIYNDTNTTNDSTGGYNPLYIQAVQKAGSQNYEPMQALLKTCFRFL